MKKVKIIYFILSIFILSFLSHSQEIRGSSPPEKTIVFLGDSITYSSINMSLNIHYDKKREGVSYVDYIREEWDSEFLIYNEGKPGDMAHYISKSSHITDRITKYNPDFVFIALGTNDWALGDPTLFRKDYNFLIDEITVQNPNVSIISLKFPYFNDSSRNMDLADDYQKVITDVSQENNLISLDIWELTYEKSCEFFVNCGAHLNEKGAKVVADYITSNDDVQKILFPPDDISNIEGSENVDTPPVAFFSKKENIFLMTIISAFILTIVLIVLKSPNLKRKLYYKKLHL